MSKQSKRKARNRRQHLRNRLVILCPDCLNSRDADAEILLHQLAEALNGMRQAGLHTVVHKGFISAEGEIGGGFVLPPQRGSGWSVHMSTYNPAARIPGREDDFDS